MVLVEEWQNFIEKGSVNNTQLRPDVVSSWLRCRHRGTNPLVSPGVSYLSQDELNAKKKQKRELLNVTREFIKEWLNLCGSDTYIGIADENCCILEVFGNKYPDKILREIDFKSGADWKEEIKGNNAIGTVVVTGAKVVFSGAEHYIKKLHNWSTCGIPIHKSDGSLTGVLAILTRGSAIQQNIIDVAVVSVAALERFLEIETQNLLLSAINSQITENSPHALMTVDTGGWIISFNHVAEELTGVRADEVLRKNIDEVLSCEDTGSGEFSRLLISVQETGNCMKDMQRLFRFANDKSRSCSVDCYPLKTESDKTIGTMVLIRSNRRTAAEAWEPEVKNAEQRTVIDSLTNVYNHKYLHERLEEELRKAHLQDSNVSLLMIDIDYFRNYNEVLGYPAGDRLLVDFALLIKVLVRGKDVVARYGGEEFAVILTGTDSKVAIEVAGRIKTQVENHPFEGRDVQPQGKITVSIGIASFPENARTREELIKKCEEALYRAKYTSKNKVAMYFSVLDDLKEELNQSDLNLLNTIKTLITVINAKDRYTYGHSERVLKYSSILAEQLALDDEQVKSIKYGAYLHDIGKIEIGREILSKNVPLTGDEWSILKCHPQWGADIIKPVKALKHILPQVLYHHERYDGTGYPEGLKGTNIPLHARILSIADSFDAMRTDRPYKKGLSQGEAIEEMKRCSGTQFDPHLAEVFVQWLTANR